MSRLHRLIFHPLAGKLFLCLLAIAYLAYLGVFGRLLSTSLFAPSQSVAEHVVETSPALAIQYWTVGRMRDAIDADQQNNTPSVFTQASVDQSLGQAAQQEGQPPSNGEPTYPLSTVGKVFLTNAAGQNMYCSGTAVASRNQSVVDTAGHCLYWRGNWVQNLVFCPLYNNGTSQYGCWAARALEVPSDWINAKPNDFHHDFGMAIVSANDQGLLTDVVGGTGWAYNQPVKQPFNAYGYPAAYPFDGQTRQTCESSSGTLWQHGDGSVVSIPCNMTGGSSGGPWFIKMGDNWYLNGHNDFTSGLQPGHMFSPYYDDTWYALYDKAQQT